MTLSVVIPVYNEAVYLPACLAALQAQTTQPLEIIVVDNGSTDQTAAIAHQYGVTVIHEAKCGSIYAQKTGFDHARGDLIARVDADTIVPAGWVEKIQIAFGDPDVMALTGAPLFYDVWAGPVWDRLQALTYQHLQKLLVGTYILWGANMAIRRQVWQSARTEVSNRTDIDDDIDLSFVLRRQAVPITYQASLQVKASFQRGRIDPIFTARYLATWPRDYRLHGMPLRALLINVLVLLGIGLSVLIWLPTKIGQMLTTIMHYLTPNHHRR